MMKHFLQIALAFVCIGCVISSALGQSKIDTIVLQKGEVLDILLLNQHPDKEAETKSYFQHAFPVAKGMSYQPQPGFKIIDHSQGNHQPQLLILGKWKDLSLREAFLTKIVSEVPDFHERRRSIWPYFGLRYFEMKEAKTLEIHRDQYQVATAFWMESADQPSTFYEKWKQEIQSSGGEILIQLADGTSPFGYQYNPDYFVLTSWESKAVFDECQEKAHHWDRDHIQH
ncbi:MAG: hypothetical protein AAF399_22960, partial [Bacteroidota bacterium]